MAVVRFKNRFGKRFLRLQELRDYAVDLDLDPIAPSEGFMEFLEAHGLLVPVRRIQLPPEIVRRFTKEEFPELDVIEPVEADGPRLDAAADLMGSLNIHRWSDPGTYGESVHVLDEIDKAHAPFIQTEFSTDAFTPWEKLRTPLYKDGARTIYSTLEVNTPAFYHYWQIFWLAAILRSGVHIFYPLHDKALVMEVLEKGILSSDSLRGRTRQSVNLEAYHELKELRVFEHHFDSVGYFKAYSYNTLQVPALRFAPYGRMPKREWRRYLSREREIGRDTFRKSGLSQDDLIAFVGQQCAWWDNARRVGPAAVAEEYKRNINATIAFLCAATGIEPRSVVDRVGRRTGHFKPTLKVIFPDWTEEQRELTILSLKKWVDKELASLPAPFPVSETELNEFCDWLEEKGLYQFYWHFRRIVDLKRRNDPVHRAASTSEVVGFCTLCEMIANEVMIDRNLVPRGSTLRPKLQKIFSSQSPVDLSQQIYRFRKLTNTGSQSLPRRLAQIRRIKAAGAHTPILCALLSLLAIRNEGAHLGLRHFDHVKVIEMIRILSIASLTIWKAR